MYINDKTMLLLHSEDFTDSSYYNVSIANTNCIVVDNGKFDKAIDCGNNGYVTWNLSNSRNHKNMTVDFWVYLKSHTVYPTIFSTNNTNDTRGLYCHFDSNKLTVNLTNSEQIRTGYTFPLNTWKHIAVTVDSSSNVSLFVDGIKEASKIIDKNVEFNKFIIGALLHNNGIDGATYSKCIVDEFRITEDVLYTQNFTPNTEPYKKTSINIIESSLEKVRFEVNGICDKVQLTVNGNLACEYTDISQIIEYDIPLSYIMAGKNDINIKVIIGDIFILKNIQLINSVANLPNESTLEDVIDRFSIINTTCSKLRLDLKDNLVAKGIEVLPTDKMSSLIDKVGSIATGKKWAKGSGRIQGDGYGVKEVRVVINAPIDFDISYVTVISALSVGGYTLDNVAFDSRYSFNSYPNRTSVHGKNNEWANMWIESITSKSFVIVLHANTANAITSFDWHVYSE